MVCPTSILTEEFVNGSPIFLENHFYTIIRTQLAQRYRQLLQDTGRMTVEDLAQKHLGVDLTQPAFWEEAVSLVLRDIDEFLALCDKVRF